MAAKGRLGRGLGALIPGASKEDSNLKEITISEIKPNPNQPRKNFDGKSFEDLVSTIKEIGIIQPVVVRKNEDMYEIIAGERRWRAAKTAGLKTIPCVIKEATEETSMQIALIENIQRQDLNPIEEAAAYQHLLSDGMSQELLAKKLGISRPYITNTLRFLRLPEKIQTMLVDGKISAGHAKAIASCKDEKMQIDLAGKIISKGLSVRDAENEAGTLKEPTRVTVNKKAGNSLSLNKELSAALGLKVTVRGDKDKGVVSIYYENKKQLNNLIKKIGDGR